MEASQVRMGTEVKDILWLDLRNGLAVAGKAEADPLISKRRLDAALVSDANMMSHTTVP